MNPMQKMKELVKKLKEAEAPSWGKVARMIEEENSRK